MVSSIFFDYRAVAGTLDVAALDDRITAAAGNQLFMAHLARVSLRFKPPLGLFQQIQATDDKVDLKKRSIAPIVAAARVYGLEAGTRRGPRANDWKRPSKRVSSAATWARRSSRPTASCCSCACASSWRRWPAAARRTTT
jgi:signal-transduction protein with cAMP-binding, CBS, and nucleotidyltransferase domain